MKTVAVCICTYQRDDGLVRLLNEIREQSVPDGWKVQVRVVNNDPGVDRRVFSKLVCEVMPSAIVSFETRQNIAHARNACLALGSADAYAFIDDDERPSVCWLSSLLVRLEDPSIDAVFGPVLGVQGGAAPRWLEKTGAFDKLGPDHDNDIHWNQTRTSSTLVRGSLIGIGGELFDPAFGQSGGSDTELFRRLELGGARFVHERKAFVYEENDPCRCRPRAVVRRRYQAGVVYGRMMFREQSEGALLHVLSRVGWGILELCVGSALMCVGKPAIAFRGICRAVGAVGCWRGRNPEYRVVRYLSKPIVLRASSPCASRC